MNLEQRIAAIENVFLVISPLAGYRKRKSREYSFLVSTIIPISRAIPFPSGVS